ncbi:MAG: hypothetical protein PVS3B1_30580 [Ktedonobacteraceae bacterium]
MLATIASIVGRENRNRYSVRIDSTGILLTTVLPYAAQEYTI